MIDLSRVFLKLPYPAKVIAASFRGYYLQRWRYGVGFDQLVDRALAREKWSAAQWRTWREERLAFVLHRAATKVPYYRAYWASQRRAGNVSSWERLENWPILQKEEVRVAPLDFVADDCNPEKMFHEHTSGTSGKPLSLWWSRQTVQEWYAMLEARLRNWHGVSRRERWAILGGQLVAPVRRSRPPYWVWNAGLNQLYLSAYHLGEQNVPYYLEAMKRHKVTYLLGYPSAMSYLARVAHDRQLEAPRLRFVLGNAEPLYETQRGVLAQVFDCPVYDSYGMAEIVAAGSECEAGSMHTWPEVGVVEILDEHVDEPVASGETGRIVATSLLNADMPLIRYELGDRGALCASNDCPCGRTLPQWQSIEGRMDDIIITPDGRHIGRLDPIFKAELPIVEAQIIQETAQRLRVVVVPAEDYSGESPSTIKYLVQDRVGNMNVIVEEVDAISRASNGKFRAVVSNLES
ncbi:MAG: phenylacetate--CoA ligase family protein [Anaerolineaceae bacterium]|nr:MAG: phenylacetate--CoA ligase family protein [Anaerolineaceae bacterium]